MEPVAGCPHSCTGSGLPSGPPVNTCTHRCGADRIHRCLLPSHPSRITLMLCSSQFSWEILWALACFPVHSGHRTEKSAVLLHHQQCWISCRAVGTSCRAPWDALTPAWETRHPQQRVRHKWERSESGPASQHCGL